MRRFSRILSIGLLVGVSAGMMPIAAQAQIAEATTDIDGLTCPFCSFGAKKRLKRVGGVGKVAVDVGKGTATLTANPGESIQVQQIPEAVKKAGFSPGGVRVVAVGQVQAHGDQLHLHLKGQSDRLVLLATDSAQGQQLRAFANQALEVEVIGSWSAPETESYAGITPDSVRER